mmetsp:Transcript_17162/g.26249  ORF Transcript_17162/g.26249 Transcript_17162/m.26249 type:complete len:103 (+) Transcript_17162:69-377(+)
MGKRIQGKRNKYGQFKEIITDAQVVYVWLTSDQVRNKIRQLEKINKPDMNNLNSAVAGLLSLSSSAKSTKGGRPKGSTNEEKKTLNQRKKMQSMKSPCNTIL